MMESTVPITTRTAWQFLSLDVADSYASWVQHLYILWFLLVPGLQVWNQRNPMWWFFYRNLSLIFIIISISLWSSANLGCLLCWRFILGFFLGAIPWYIGLLLLVCGRIDYREKPGYIACTIAVSLYLSSFTKIATFACLLLPGNLYVHAPTLCCVLMHSGVHTGTYSCLPLLYSVELISSFVLLCTSSIRAVQ